jgi:hypothetical protein
LSITKHNLSLSHLSLPFPPYFNRCGWGRFREFKVARVREQSLLLLFHTWNLGIRVGKYHIEWFVKLQRVMFLVEGCVQGLLVNTPSIPN